MKNKRYGLVMLSFLVGCGPDADPDGLDSLDATISDADLAIENDDSPSTTEPVTPVLPVECVSVVSAGEGVEAVKIDLETGATTQLVGDFIPPEDGPEKASLARAGNYLLFCATFSSVGRLDLTTGDLDLADVSCDAVASAGEGLLVLPFGGDVDTIGELHYFEGGFDAIAEGAEPQVIDADHWASRLTVHDEVVYLAWHSTDHVQRRTADGAALSDLYLSGFDDWVMGMEVVNDELVVLSSDGLHRFSLEDGSPRGFVEIPWPVMLEGLACAPVAN